MAMFEQLVFPTLVILFFVAGLAAAAVGLGLVACSSKVFGLLAVMDRSVSTRRATRSISVPRDIEPALLKHRKWLAAAIIAGSAWSLYSLLAHFDAAAVAAAVTTAEDGGNYFLAHWFIEALGWAMIAFSLFAMATGIMLAFFPAALRAVEQHANRWYSTRKALAGAETMHLPLDRWVERYPRTAGLVITAGALIVVASSGLILFK